jgi:hypothetical protein
LGICKPQLHESPKKFRRFKPALSEMWNFQDTRLSSWIAHTSCKCLLLFSPFPKGPFVKELKEAKGINSAKRIKRVKELKEI